MTENNKNLIISVEGFGVSNFWQKNAIKTANMESFWNIWNSYPHIVVENKSGKVENLAAVYLPYRINDVSKIPNMLQNCELSNDNMITEMSRKLSESHSNLHLFFYIEESNFNYYIVSLETILSKLKILKSQVNIHIIYDETFDKDVLKISLMEIEEKAQAIGAQLVSAASFEILSLENSAQKYFHDLAKVSRSTFMSLSQYYSKAESSESIIRLTNEYNKPARIHDFDLSIFFNLNSRINKLAQIYQNISKTISFSKFTSSCLIFQSNNENLKHLPFLVSVSNDDFVTKLLENGNSVKLFSDNSDSEVCMEHKQLSSTYPAGTDLNTILKDAQNHFLRGETDTTIIDLSMTRKLVFEDFSKIVDWLKILDAFLGEIHRLMKEADTLVFFSTSSYLDQVKINKNNGKIFLPEIQKMPFLIASKKYPLKRKQEIILELLSKNSASLDNIYPSLLKYLNIRQNINRNGSKSVLNKMR